MLRARSLLAGLILAGASMAQAETPRKVDLPAGGLGQAIIALGRQAGINIGVSDPSLATLPVKRVRGMRLLEPAWKTRTSPASAPAVVASKEAPHFFN